MRIAALLILYLPLTAQEWPEFLGPSEHTKARNVPVAWSATKNVAWKVPVPGRGWSSPVLAGGRIYLTTAVPAADQHVSLRAMCFNAADGKVVWDKEVLRPASGETRPVHQKNTLASPTPVVRGDKLYIHFGHMGTAALDLSGNVLWRQTGIAYSPVHGNGGSPVLASGVLIFTADGADDSSLVALDASTGQIRWKTPRNTPARNKFSFGTPLIVGQQVVSPASGLVAGYDIKTGRELWRVLYGEGFSVVPRPALAHGLLFVATGFDRPELWAVRLSDSHVIWKHTRGAPHTPSPLAVGDEIYIVSDGGIGTCLDAKTGKVHWNRRLGGTFSASPVFADGRIYFQNEDGVGYVIKPGTAYELLATNDLGERTLATPAITEGALFIRSENNLWKIAAQR